MSKLELVPLDWETFYDDEYSLSKMPAEEYIRDPRFEIIGLGIRWPGANTRWLSGPEDQLRAGLQKLDWSNKIVVGHNLSEFDALILTERMGIRPKFYQCTLAMARALHGGKQAKSLAAMCKLYKLPDKGDEVVKAKGKRRADFTAKELAAYGRYCIGDVDRCAELYEIFRKRLPAHELQYLHLLIRMWAEPRLHLDLDLLRKLGAEVAQRKETLLRQVVELIDNGAIYTPQHAQKLLRSDAKFAAALQLFGVDPPMKFSPKRKNPDGTPMQVYAFAKSDQGMTDLLEDEDERVQTLAAARLGVKTTIEESRILRFTGIAERGALPVPIAYGKTHTHRGAGAGKINMQNMGRVKKITKKIQPGDLIMTPVGARVFDAASPTFEQLRAQQTGEIFPIKKCHRVGLRDVIIAPPGKRLVVVDSSNIELRVCHLLAGQMDTVEMLRMGEDLYAWFAGDLYGYPVNKDDHPDERQHGKVGMLQLQYQAGAKSLRNAARVQNGLILTMEESERTVQVYRGRFTQVKKLWYKSEDAIKRMVNGSRDYIDQWGLCHTEKDKIVGPNGMCLNYDNIRYDSHVDYGDGYIYENREERKIKRIYGGAVVENLSQWLARDIVFEQMLDAERRYGGPSNGVALTAHDEILVVVDEDRAEECLKWCIQRMSQAPKWWPQIPLAAEGAIGTVYGNCK